MSRSSFLASDVPGGLPERAKRCVFKGLGPGVTRPVSLRIAVVHLDPERGWVSWVDGENSIEINRIHMFLSEFIGEDIFQEGFSAFRCPLLAQFPFTIAPREHFMMKVMAKEAQHTAWDVSRWTAEACPLAQLK